ncbi:transmembrane protein 254 isoform 1-T1 [Polymixia lowei]
MRLLQKNQPLLDGYRDTCGWILYCKLVNSDCIVFAPEKIPFEYLGSYGTFCIYLVDNHADLMYKGWWAAFAIHVFEALIAMNVCSKKGIDNMAVRCLWFVQTLLFGFASLGLLLKYNPERPKQQ